MAKTLRMFIAANNLNPEDGGLGLDWFRPDEMLFVETRREDENTELHIFSDGSTRCAILDTATASILMSEDELMEHEQSENQG